MSFSVTVKDEEETEKDDRSHRASDNSRCPSSIVLAVTIPSNIGNIGATTTSGSSSNAGRIAPLAEWVPRIEGMRACDLAGTGSRVVTTCYEPLGVAI